MATVAVPSTQQAPPLPASDIRQLVTFHFYRVDPLWRRQSQSARRKQVREFITCVSSRSKKLMVMTYSLVGMKADVDFLIWTVASKLEDLQDFAAAIRQTELGAYLTMPHSFLSMTKRSVYVDKLDPDHPDKRRYITPAKSKYFFIYPFVKTHAWYQMPLEQRQALMDEHIVVGNKYKSVKLHTTYSFGLDDQEFVVAFECDEPKDFLDLVMELRSAKQRVYTLRDTPIFTAIYKPLPEIIESL